LSVDTQTKQIASDSHANNFTALRLFAAFLVLYGHAFDLYKLTAPSFLGWMPLGPVAVYIFFSISGYLISISWERDSHIVRFVLKRALRIFPGLIVCILLTIFILGTVTTTLPLSDYIRNPETWAYVKNIFLYINYTLPGVFENNIYPRAVNGSIWSLPIEFAMYLIFACLALILRDKWPQRVGVFLLGALFLVANYYIGLSTVIFYSFPLQYLAICGVYFLAGVVIHQWRLLKILSTPNVLFSIIIWLSVSRWPILFEYASYVVIPILVIAFGAGASKAFTWLDKYDYSYGVYIYAFPVQQLISFYFFNYGLRFGIVASAFVTLCLAALSWHWVEKPALQYKKLFKTNSINF
jgi:peptidoglycan/LPS O-acetylase OafA/YrhL